MTIVVIAIVGFIVGFVVLTALYDSAPKFDDCINPWEEHLKHRKKL